MRVQTEEWRRFIPGVRMYKGKMTLFYNGEILDDPENDDPLIYNQEESLKWEVIMVLPGVEVIPESTFWYCMNVKTVIMADTVRRIEDCAFYYCTDLVYIQLSRNLEYIGVCSFYCCRSLPSIFIPPSCTEIGRGAFRECDELIIFSVSRNTQLGRRVIASTALIRASTFPTNGLGYYPIHEDVNTWIKNRLQGDEFALHRACSSFNPLEEVIYGIVKRQGLQAFKKPDSIGVTPSQYLSENPFAEIDQHKLMKRYILDMMGEIVS